MSGSEHVFSMKASWSGGVKSVGHLEGGALASDISSPGAFGGPGKGTNPEELVLAAASSCYVITLAAICERRELPVASIALTSDIKVAPPPSVKLIEITHHPRITVSRAIDDETRAKILDAAARAEKACMISNALRGNVPVLVDATIVENA